jgi:ribosome-binding protein aMBF1 (putative translation factor)
LLILFIKAELVHIVKHYLTHHKPKGDKLMKYNDKNEHHQLMTLIKQRNLSRGVLARMLNISYSYFNSIVYGYLIPSAELQKRLAELIAEIESEQTEC